MWPNGLKIDLWGSIFSGSVALFLVIILKFIFTPIFKIKNYLPIRNEQKKEGCKFLRMEFFSKVCSILKNRRFNVQNYFEPDDLQVWESSYSTVEYQPIINRRLKWPQAVGNMVVNHWLTFYFHISVKNADFDRLTTCPNHLRGKWPRFAWFTAPYIFLISQYK